MPLDSNIGLCNPKVSSTVCGNGDRLKISSHALVHLFLTLSTAKKIDLTTCVVGLNDRHTTGQGKRMSLSTVCELTQNDDR